MNEALKSIAQRAFLAGDKVGVHVLPAHYYSPVASRRELRSSEASWRRPVDADLFDADLDEQLAWVAGQAGPYASELPLSRLAGDAEAVGGLRYGFVEAQLLHGFLRTSRPGRVVEIGSGSSTLVMSQAIERNVADGFEPTSVVACDPYTANRVARLPHVDARAIGGREVDDVVAALGDGDLLFIDSTHALRTGSELSHIYLELLPHLVPGVVVHIHDIYLPYVYSPDIYNTMFDWQETTLVAALLTGNRHLTTLACLSALHHGRPEGLTKVFPEYRPEALDRGVRVGARNGHFPTSLWLRVAKI